MLLFLDLYTTLVAKIPLKYEIINYCITAFFSVLSFEH